MRKVEQTNSSTEINEYSSMVVMMPRPELDTHTTVNKKQ